MTEFLTLGNNFVAKRFSSVFGNIWRLFLNLNFVTYTDIEVTGTTKRKAGIVYEI